MIEARGLTKRYGRVVATAGLSFEARPGRVTGFLGANGSGQGRMLAQTTVADLSAPAPSLEEAFFFLTCDSAATAAGEARAS